MCSEWLTMWQQCPYGLSRAHYVAAVFPYEVWMSHYVAAVFPYVFRMAHYVAAVFPRGLSVAHSVDAPPAGQGRVLSDLRGVDDAAVPRRPH